MIAKRYVSVRVSGLATSGSTGSTDTLWAALVRGGDLRQQMSRKPGRRHHGQLAMGGGVSAVRVGRVDSGCWGTDVCICLSVAVPGVWGAVPVDRGSGW